MQFRLFPRLTVVILILLSISIGLGQAQDEENLLDNPGFEGSFSNVAGSWQSWIADDTNAPDFQEDPLFFAATNAGDNGLITQIRSGSNAQAIFSFFATHDAGVYQQVSGITPGTELRFSIYGHVFSNNLTDLDISEDDGGVAVRVGIDPTGGTDPFSSNIVYSEPFITYDSYIQYNIIALAESETVTVFVRSTITEPVQNTVVFLDDAVLNVTPDSPQPTEEVETEEPTDEPVDSEPTPTREVSDETEEPTAEPTTEEPDTPTSVPTATSVPDTDDEDDTPITDEFPEQVIHIVSRGDTVGALATRYGSSVEAIIEVNGLNASALIFVEQTLIIPVRVAQPTAVPSPTTDVVEVTPTEEVITGGSSYVVQRGDNLSSIARRFNTTVGALVQLNGIANPNRIVAGQTLNLPSGSGPVVTPTATQPPTAPTVAPPPPTNTTYVVRPGDNLYRIALRNNVSLIALAEANNITNFNLIFVGQVLTIPR